MIEKLRNFILTEADKALLFAGTLSEFLYFVAADRNELSIIRMPFGVILRILYMLYGTPNQEIEKYLPLLNIRN